MRATRALVLVMVALCLAAPVGILLGGTTDAKAYGGITIDFERPSYAGTSQTIQCVLRLSGGPAGDDGGNFTYRVEFAGKNVTGAVATPNTATSQTGVFVFNMTMPTVADQTMTVTVNATSKSTITRESMSSEMNYKIKIVEPVVISAEVFNSGYVDARNVTAKFLADGEFLGEKVFNLSAGKSQVLTYNWTFLKIGGGKHVVTVMIDDPNNVVEFSDGNNVLSRTIYLGNTGNPAGAILTVGVVVASFFVVLMYFQKPMRKPKK